MADNTPSDDQSSPSPQARQSGVGHRRHDGPGWPAIGIWLTILAAVVGFGYTHSERLTRVEEAVAGERGLNYRMEQVEDRLDALAVRVQDLDTRLGSMDDAVRDHTATLGEVRATVSRALGTENSGPAIREPSDDPPAGTGELDDR